MNEHQVAIGESTCAAKLTAEPIIVGGKALLEAAELSQIALERSRTSREAIMCMGELATQYGFYSAAWVSDLLLSCKIIKNKRYVKSDFVKF